MNQIKLLTGRVLFVAALLSLYIQLSFEIPYGPFFATTFPLAFFLRSSPLLSVTIIPFGSIAILSLFFTALRFPADLGNQTDSSILLLLSIGAGSVLSTYMYDLGKERVGRWFWWISITLLVGAALEVAGPLKGISDSVRGMLYSDTILYTNDARDIQQFGLVRPKLFTSEPSHFGKFITLCVLVSFLAKGHPIRHGLVLVVAYLISNTSVILFGGVAVFAVFVQRTMTSKRYRQLTVISVISLSLGVLILSYYLAVDRLGFGGEPIEASAFMRVVRPYLVAHQALQESPFIGFGIGSSELLSGFNVIATYGDPSQKYAQQLLTEGAPSVWGNVHFALIPQLGVLGSVMWLIVWDRIRAIRQCPRIIFWGFYFVYGISLGAINTPLFVVPLLVVAQLGHWSNLDALATTSYLGVRLSRRRSLPQ